VMVGLPNVNNTSDLNKPISFATQTALALKEDAANKSIAASLGYSDVLYPSQKAVKTYVDATVASGAPDATLLSKGLIQLTGHLGGTSDNPTVPDLALKAPLADPTFTGTPVAPTAGYETSTDQIATTDFVQNVSRGKVADAINDDITAVAPSQNAVFDGLAGKMSYPSSAGSNGEVLTTDGSNGLSWSTSSSGVPYSGASGVVNLGDYDLTVQGYRIGKGTGGASGNLVFGTATLSGSGTGNTVIGVTAAHSLGTGTNNTIIGNAAGWYIGNTSGITAIGQSALHAESGAGNTALGYRAGYHGSVSSAMTYTTLLGYEAKATSGAITNSVALGKGATVLASNTIQLGNTSVTNVKTSGTITVGAITIPKTDGSSGEVLTTDGSGALS